MTARLAPGDPPNDPAKGRPSWCRCDAAWYQRGLLDPNCRHDDIADLLEDAGTRSGITDRIEELQRSGSWCCEVGCGDGGCESCPCCDAGWCLSGKDGLPTDPADRAHWLEVAAEYNPLVPLLVDTEQRGQADAELVALLLTEARAWRDFDHLAWIRAKRELQAAVEERLDADGDS